MNYEPGKRIKFAEEKVSYKIIAANDRFLICTKPFNLKKTFIYTIVDLVENRRGPDNMIFGPQYNYSDPVEASQALKDLMEPYPSLKISHRRDCTLNVEWIK